MSGELYFMSRLMSQNLKRGGDNVLILGILFDVALKALGVVESVQDARDGAGGHLICFLR